MNRKLIPLLRILAIVTVSFAGLTQARGAYQMPLVTLSTAAGLRPSTSTSYRLLGTIGQPDAGVLTSTSYILVGGFWVSGCECTSNPECDNNLFCDGEETCLDCECQAGTDPCGWRRMLRGDRHLRALSGRFRVRVQGRGCAKSLGSDNDATHGAATSSAGCTVLRRVLGHRLRCLEHRNRRRIH